MKNCLLALIIVLALPHALHAQIPDEAITQMMTERILNPYEIYYNALTLIPRLYNENKTDTLHALLKYCNDKGATGAAIANFEFLLEIRENKFTEEIKYRPLRYSGKATDQQYYEETIFQELYWYRNEFGNSERGAYRDEQVNTIYENYFRFIQQAARSQLSRTDLTSVERFLLTYFVSPSDTLYQQISGPEFDGTVLKKAWITYHKQHRGITGNEYGFVTGAWIPTGNLSVVGTHPIYGVLGAIRGYKFTWGGELSIRFLNAPQKYVVPVNNNIYYTDHFLDAFMCIFGSYELFRTKRSEMDVVAGTGYEGFDAFKSNSSSGTTDNPRKSFDTWNTNFGLGYRYYITHKDKENWGHHVYLALQLRYNLLHFDNPGGTDLTGNSWTVNLMIGAIDRDLNKRKKKH